MTKKKGFVHLHVHTEYSLLDGLSNTKKLFEHVKENGMDTIAITDHGAMYGVIEFYKNALKAGVKPILGMEGYITDGNRKERGDSKNRTFHQLLLAKNLQGYKNLMKLTSIAHVEGYYKRPRIDHETLQKYHDGIIATSSCVMGEIPQALIEGDYVKAKKLTQWYVDVFGEDFYLELQRHEYAKHVKSATTQEIIEDLNNQDRAEKLNNQGQIKLSRELGIPLIATNDAHYIKKDDATAQDALVCIATGRNVSDVKRLRFIDAPSYYITTPDEMAELFSDVPEVLTNTQNIADKCELEIELGVYHFPKIILPKGKTAEQQLTKETEEGARERYPKLTPEIKKRMKYELDIIISKGYAAYFLIFRDMAKWAIEKRIPINVRGSVAGSLVSYSLGITTVDPIRFNLPFERFLNPYRPSAPDIDLDIADDKRNEMIAYLTQKYGHEKVAQICTFGRMLARGSVRDVARVLGYPYETGDKIAKLIPMGSQGFPMTIDRALQESSDLKSLYGSDADAKKIIDLAQKIEGSARHVSVHAGGVVISPNELTEFTPIQLDTSEGEKLITQYEMHAVEDVGLVKLDILGIRNLSILREAVERVHETTGKVIDIRNIPLDDKKTFKMLSNGETMGVFQLSGSGMTRYLVELKPEKIEDIMMMIALFRPGPMKNIDEYIARKRGEKPVTYYDPKMEQFLDKSLGVLVYQDDLLYTALYVAGYNWEEVDKFRKAVGKKIPEEMARQHEIFVKGCMKTSGMSKEKAEGLWDLFEPFQGYGFNKAHSASYGMVSYQTAYMKANYPVEYMTALLTAESGDTDKISSAIAECKRLGIKILPPDINESQVGFTVVTDKESVAGKAIRFGLNAIKNVGEAAIEAILSAREKNKFVSFADFCARVDSRKVNKKVVESLIKVGAMSPFGQRAALLDVMDEVRSKARPVDNNGQQDLFSTAPESLKMAEEQVQQINSGVAEFDTEELENLERELLGFSLNAKSVEETIGELVAYRSHRIDEIMEQREQMINAVTKIAGIVAEVRIVTTKRTGAEMAFARIEDETGSIDVVIFPKIYAETKSVWAQNSRVLLEGKVDEREDELNLLVNLVQTEQMLKSGEGKLRIFIPRQADKEILLNLKQTLLSNQGNQSVTLIFESKNNKEYELPFKIAWSKQLSDEISHILYHKEVN
jgi:DNA polymerase-3 subunit alpha